MSSITITYGRKIPGQQQFSSESLQVTIVQDMGEHETEDAEIRTAIEAIYQLVKAEVDKRMQPLGVRPQLPVKSNGNSGDGHYSNGSNGDRFSSRQNGTRKASNKQVSFLLSLANQRGVDFETLGSFLQDQCGKRDPYELTSSEASRIIEALK